MRLESQMKAMHGLRKLWASKPKQDAFWAQNQKSEACWNWTGPLNRDGYGTYGDLLAHRIAFFLSNNHLFLDMHVLHSCPEKASAIKTERASGALLRELSAKYGVGISTIARTVRGESWA